MNVGLIRNFTEKADQFLELNKMAEVKAQGLDPETDKVKLLVGTGWSWNTLAKVDFTEKRASFSVWTATNFKYADWAIKKELDLITALVEQSESLSNQGLEVEELESVVTTMENVFKKGEALITCLKCVQNGYNLQPPAAPGSKLKHSQEQIAGLEVKIRAFENALGRLEGSLNLLKNPDVQCAIRNENRVNQLGDDRNKLMEGDVDFCTQFANSMFAENRDYILSINPAEERAKLMTSPEQGLNDLNRATLIIDDQAYPLNNPKCTFDLKKEVLLNFCNGNEDLFNKLLSMLNQSKLSTITRHLSIILVPAFMSIGKPEDNKVEMRFHRTPDGLIHATFSSLFRVSPLSEQGVDVLTLKGEMELVISERDLVEGEYSNVQFIPRLDKP